MNNALHERAERALTPFIGRAAGGVVFAASQSDMFWRGYMLKNEDFSAGNSVLLTLLPAMIAGNLALQRDRGHSDEKFCTSSDFQLPPLLLEQLLVSGRLLSDAFDCCIMLLAYAVPPLMRVSITVNRGGIPLQEFIPFVQKLETARKELWSQGMGPELSIETALRRANLL